MSYLDRLKKTETPVPGVAGDFQKSSTDELTKPTKPDIASGAVPAPAANDTDPDTLPDPVMERRRQAVLRMLRENPEIERAWVANADQDPVRVHLAIRGKGSCELTIAADRWDEFKFLELLEKQEGTA